MDSIYYKLCAGDGGVVAVKCCPAVAVVEVCGGDALGCGARIDNGTQTDLISVILSRSSKWNY